MHEVTCFTEQRRAFSESMWSLDWTSNRAFETLAVTILFFEVVQICRLWDPPEEEGHSIPALAEAVTHAQVLGLVETQVPDELKDRDMTALRAALAGATEVVNSDETTRLRNYRHKLAHAVLRTDKEGKGSVDKATIQDADLIVDRSVILMTRISSIIRQSDFDHVSDQQTEREISQQFFSALAPSVAAIVPRR